MLGNARRLSGLTDVSERKENVAHVAQRELDRILSLPYSQVRLLTMPVHSTVTDNPNY